MVPKRGSQKAKPYHHGSLRSALLREGLKAVERGGAKGVSLRDLARSLGVSPMAPYRHFSSKDALLQELALEGFARFAEVLESAWRRGEEPSLKKRFFALGRAYLQFAKKFATHYELMFSASLSTPVPPTASAQEIGAASFAVLLEAVLTLMKEGILPTQDPLPVALSIWAHVHGMAGLLRDPRIVGLLGARGVNTWIDGEFERLLRGLSAKGSG